MHDNLPRMTQVKQNKKRRKSSMVVQTKWRAGNLVIAISSWRMTILGRKEETTEYPTVMLCFPRQQQAAR